MHVHLPLYAAARFLKQSRNGRYGACVEAVDWATGVLLHELARLGLEANTLVVFTSDNGSRGDNGGSNAPLRGNKTTTWEGGQRLPCIARWPGRIPAGSVCREIATSLDFLPTFARLAGGSPPADRIIDGKDIRPLLLAEPGATSPHEAFFFYWMDQIEAVRAGRWKLHIRKRDHVLCELYDLESDIGESTDLAAANPGVVARLMTLVERCRADLGDAAVGLPGANCRPSGRVEKPETLTHYDPAHPYLDAMYDLNQVG
jgi:arylsulfatase A-like enzyme